MLGEKQHASTEVSSRPENDLLSTSTFHGLLRKRS